MPKLHFIRTQFLPRLRTVPFIVFLAVVGTGLCAAGSGSALLQAGENPSLSAGQFSDSAAIVVSAAEYTVKSNRSRLTMTALLRLHVPEHKQAGLKLRLGSGSLESARVGKQPVVLQSTGGTQHVVATFPGQTGDLLLKLVVSTRWQFAGEDRVATISLPVSSPAVMRFSVAAGERLRVNGAALKRVAPLEKETVYEFPVGNQRQVEVRLVARGARHTADSVTRARSRIELAVQPHVVRWKSETRLQNTGRPLSSVQMTLPGPFKILGVLGPDVASWQAVEADEDDGGETTLQVRFRWPVSSETTLNLTGLITVGDEPFWNVPSLQIAGVAAHTGEIFVSPSAGMRVRVDEFSGVQQKGDSSGRSYSLPPLSRGKWQIMRAAVLTGENRHSLSSPFWGKRPEEFPQIFSLSPCPPVPQTAPPLLQGGLVLPAARLPQRAATEGGRVFPAGIPILLPTPSQSRLAQSYLFRNSEPPGPLLAFDFFQQDYELVLVFGQPAFRATAVTDAVLHIGEADVRLNFEARLSANRRLQQVRVQLPAEWAVRRLHVAGHPVRWISEPVEAGIRHIVFSVPEPDTSGAEAGGREKRGGASPGGELRLTLQAVHHLEWQLSDTGEAEAKFPLPDVRLPDARLQQGTVRLRAEKGTVVATAGLKRLLPVAAGNSADRLALRYILPPRSAEGIEGRVHLRRKPQPPAVIPLLVARLQEDRLLLRYVFRFQPGESERSNLLVQLKTAETDNARQPRFNWQGKGVRLIAADRLSSGKLQRWNLRFDGPLRWPGELIVSLSVRLPQREGDRKLPRVTIAGVTGQPGYVVLASHPRQILRLLMERSAATAKREKKTEKTKKQREKKGGDRKFAAIPVLDRTEVPSSVWTVFDEEKSESPDLFPTVCPLWESAQLWLRLKTLPTEDAQTAETAVMLLHSRLRREGTFQHRVHFTTAAPYGSFLRVRLPANSRMQDVCLNGRSVCWLEEEDGVLVPLNYRENPEGRQGVTVQLEYRRQNGPLTGCGHLQLTAPQISLLLPDGMERLLRTGEEIWTVSYPDNVLLTTVRGAFHPLQALDQTGWLTGMGHRSVGKTSAFRSPSVLRFRRSKGNPSHAPVLNLSYETHSGGLRWRLGVLSAVVWLFWLLQKWSPRWCALGTVLGIVVPIVLLLWLPADSAVYLDGLFLGALLSAVICGISSTGKIVAQRMKDRLVSQGRGQRPIFAPLRLARRWMGGLLFFSLITAGTAERLCAADADNAAVRKTGVSSAAYILTLRSAGKSGKWLAGVEARFETVNATQRPASVLLPLGAVPLQSATVNGQPAVVGAAEISRSERGRPLPATEMQKKQSAVNPRVNDPRLKVVLPAAGRNTIRLRFTLAGRREGDAQQFVLPVRPVPAGTALLVLPSSGWHVTAGQQGEVYQPLRQGEKWVVRLPVARRKNLRLRLLPEDAALSPAVGGNLRCESAVRLSNSGVLQQDRFRISIRRGTVSSWKFLLPPEIKLTGVQGPTVSGWTVTPTDNERREVLVTFYPPLCREGGETDVLFRLYRPASFSEEPVPLEISSVLSVTRPAAERRFTIRSEDGIVVRETELRGVQRISGTQRISPGNSSPDRWNRTARRYRAVQRQAVVGLEAFREAAQAAVRAEHLVSIGGSTVEVESRLSFHLSGPPQSTISLFLPEGFLLHRLHCEPAAEWSFGEDETMVYVTLSRPSRGVIRMTLHGSLPRDAAAPTATLPIPTPLTVQSISHRVKVRPPRDFGISLQKGEGWQQRLPSSQPLSHPAPLRANRPAEKNAFPTQDEPIFSSDELEPSPLEVRLIPRPATAQGRLFTVVQVAHDSVAYSFWLQCRGLRGNPRVVAVTVPAWLAPHLQFRQDAQCSIQPYVGNPLPGGQRRWIISRFSNAPARDEDGLFTIRATAVFPGDPFSHPRIRIPHWTLQRPEQPTATPDATRTRFVPAKIADQILLLRNLSPYRLEQLETSSRSVALLPEQMMSLDLPPSLKQMGKWRPTDEVWRMTADGSPPIWMLRRRSAPVGSDLVIRSRIETELQSDGSCRHRIRYHVRHRRQRFLALRCPLQSRIVRARVDGAVVPVLLQPGENGNLRLISLPEKVDGTESVVEVDVAGECRGNRLESSTRWTVQAPRIVSRQPKREAALPVGTIHWTVRTPAELVVSLLSRPEAVHLRQTQPKHAGREFHFDTLKGNPQLTLEVRNRVQPDVVWSAFATLVWLVVAAAAVLAIRGKTGR